MVDEAQGEPALAGVELYLTEVRWRRDDQVRRLTELNQKLVTTFTLNVAMITVLSATLRLSSTASPLPTVFEYLIFSIGFLFCVNIGASAWAYRVGRLGLLPNIRALLDNLRSYEVVNISLWTANEMLRVLESNEQFLARRAFWTSLALVTTTFTLIVVIAVVAAALRI